MGKKDKKGKKSKAPKNPPWAPIAGARITFKPKDGSKSRRGGVFLRDIDHKTYEVQLDGDPFTVSVNADQVTTSSTNETQEVPAMSEDKSTTKTLRKKAKALKIEGWEEMDLATLTEAVATAENGSAPAADKPAKGKASKGAAKKTAPAKKTAAKKSAAKKTAPAKKAAAPAKKAAAKKTAPAKKTAEKVEPAENGNPFKPGTNFAYIADEVIAGGKRSKMVKALKKKVELQPRSRAGADFDVDAELDRRILIVGQTLKKDYGFTVEREGRGADATIVATPPSS